MINCAAIALAPERTGRVALPNGGRDIIYTLLVSRRAGRGPEVLAFRTSLPIRSGKLRWGHLLLLSARA